jgi:hypothetical protein
MAESADNCGMTVPGSGSKFGRTGSSRVRASGSARLRSSTDANGLVADIHDRMPVILAAGDYARWLGEEPDPRLDATISLRLDADVADLDTSQQA